MIYLIISNSLPRHPQYHKHTDSLKSKVGCPPGDGVILSVYLAVGTEGVFDSMHNMMVQ